MDNEKRNAFIVGGACVVLFFGATGWVTVEKVQEDKFKYDVSRSAAGKFAMSNLAECTESKGLFDSGKSEVECISIVIRAAKDLKGEGFAGEVSRSLETLHEHSEKKR